jgi:hypothetical protein
MTFGTLPGAEAAVDLATAVLFEEIQRYFVQIKIQEQNLRLALDAGQTINPPRVARSRIEAMKGVWKLSKSLPDVGVCLLVSTSGLATRHNWQF